MLIELDGAGAKPSQPAETKAEWMAPASTPIRDPRFAQVEPLVGRNAWRDIVERLGPANEAGELPPGLTLVLAVAQREAAGEASAAGANALAIQSMADLLGVAPGSHTALLLAKRLLRQPPASWTTKPAPPARFTALIILFGIALGVAAGRLVSLGSIRFF
jgi:hypothetical protein